MKHMPAGDAMLTGLGCGCENALMRSSGRSSIQPIGSTGSILSIGSTGSILSIGSTGSILSIGSAASILSILSFGSAGSVLSFGSAGSILSALSRGSVRAWRGGHQRPAGSLEATPAPGSAGPEDDQITA